MPGLARRPSSWKLSAITASSWSPSTRWPRSSAMMHAVGVAVERDADVGAHLRDLGAERLRRGRAAFAVDVEAVGLDPDRDHVGAELPQRLRHHPVGGAVGAIDHDAQPVETERARQRALGEFDVAVVHAVDALGAAEIGALGELLGQVGIDQRLDLVLDLVGELVAVGPEQLDAVVVVGIVRGRDHHAEIGAHRAGEHGDRRRRHRAGQQHVHADRGEAGDQRGLDHVARQAGVLADQRRGGGGRRGERPSRPPARPRSASSGVITPLARPRMPSVPKYLRTMFP